MNGICSDGCLVSDKTLHRVELDGQALDLTPKEFDLLAFLAASPDQVYSREELLEHVWGSTQDWQDPATVTEHVRRLRLKLEADPSTPRSTSRRGAAVVCCSRTRSRASNGPAAAQPCR